MNIKNVSQRDNVSNRCKTIKHRIQKYSFGSHSLAVLSGVLGQTAICSASVVDIDVSGLVGMSFIANGSPFNTNFNITESTSDPNDRLNFRLDNGIFFIRGLNGAQVFRYFNSFHNTYVMPVYALASFIDGTQFEPNVTGNISRLASGGGYGLWGTDRTGTIGFISGDNQFGFLNFTWESQVFTVIGGKIETSSGVGITATAVGVPEPSQYAAALGLGALGLAYYRRRPGNKIRPKNN